MRLLKPHSFTLLVVGVVLAGILLALVVQPPPPSFAAGWSAPRPLTSVDLRESKQIVLSPNQTFRLVWVHVEGGVSQIFAARLNLNGEWVEPPTRISRAGARSIAPQLIVLPDGSDVIAYVEKTEQGGLMMSDGRQLPLRIVEAKGDMRQLSLLNAEQTLFAAWSENREKQPFVYLTYFYGWDGASPAFVEEPQIVNLEKVLAQQPILAVSDSTLHAFYFTDDNRFVDLRLRSQRILPGNVRVFFEPLGGAQILSHRPTSAGGAYPVTVRVDARGTLYLFESAGGPVSLTRFGADGARLDAQPIALERVRSRGAVDARFAQDQLWLAWSVEPRRSSAAQVFLRRFNPDGKPQGGEQRLTFASGGAFQPQWFMDRTGAQHLFWVQTGGDGDAALFYANTIRPADVTVFQRLGFAGDNGALNLLVTVATAFMYVVPLLVVNIWRVVVVSLTLLAAHRFLPGRHSILLAIFVVCELLLSAPTSEMIGQSPVVLSPLAHWAFVAPVLALTVALFRRWRSELTEVLRWLALAFIWTYVYYWMNALVILREAYAV